MGGGDCVSAVIHCIVEYNDDGYLVYAGNYPGAYARGMTKEEALKKMPDEIRSYQLWSCGDNIKDNVSIEIQEEKKSNLHIRDADSDVLFESEQPPLSEKEYLHLKSLVLKSARDFKVLYDSFPKKDVTNKKSRTTFYGSVPMTANEILIHTNGVTNYYIGEIGGRFNSHSDIFENRMAALECVETLPHFLENKCFKGSHGELWSLRKVMRRFIWHDRIHAKSMYRMGVSIWRRDIISNPYCFNHI